MQDRRRRAIERWPVSKHGRILSKTVATAPSSSSPPPPSKVGGHAREINRRANRNPQLTRRVSPSCRIKRPIFTRALRGVVSRTDSPCFQASRIEATLKGARLGVLDSLWRGGEVEVFFFLATLYRDIILEILRARKQEIGIERFEKYRWIYLEGRKDCNYIYIVNFNLFLSFIRLILFFFLEIHRATRSI